MRRAKISILVFSVLAGGLLSDGLASADPNATITASFRDSCRDFEAHSSKDISHVEIHYADGRVVKDERINSRDYSVDGGPGAEIAWVVVKSGRTAKRFDCRGESPLVAVLELNVPPNCSADMESNRMFCGEVTLERTEWTSFDGTVVFDADYCRNDPALCRFTFRGTTSADPDGDIASWSLDFGDGTSVGGDWSTEPPAELVHSIPVNTVATLTLTVTDSSGRTDSDSMKVFTFIND